MRLRVGVLLVICHVVVAPAFAQLDTATAVGSVTDAHDASIPGATVTARNTDTGFTRSTVSDSEGRYRLSALTPGSYELHAELHGFSTVIRNGVTLAAGSESIINFSMTLASVTEEVVVSAEIPIVETRSASTAMRMTRREIDLLPLIGRSYLGLLRLAPTAALNNRSYSFGGSRSRSNQWFVDGLENSDDVSGWERTNPAIESIAEVQILVNGFKAEFGQSSGGVVNVITRSGTNTPHGSGFFSFHNQHMMARDPYAAEKDPFQRIHYGGTAGGPIRRDKAHYFISLEREHRDTYDTATQVLPSSSAAFAASTLQFLSENNIPPSIFGAGGPVRQSRPEYVNHHKFSARLDQRVSASQTVTLKYTLDFDRQPTGLRGTLHDYSGTQFSERQHYAAVTHKGVLGSNNLNETYFHVGRDTSRADATFPNLTNVSVSGAFELGGGNLNRFKNYVAQAVDQFSWAPTSTRTGEHVFKAGALVKLFRSDGQFDTNFRGSYTFPDLQAFIDGHPSRFTANQGDNRLKRPNNAIGLYVQDDWRPVPDLTLNVGVRYDFEDAKTEALRDINLDGSPGPGISRDTNNVAPRFGFAWAPANSSTHSFYGGTGIYYDQIILTIIGNARLAPPKVIGIRIDNPSWPDPFAGGTVRVPPPSVSIIDPELVTPYNWNSQIGYRRELLTDVGIDVSFIYNRGYDHVAVIDTNSGIPGTATITGAGAARLDPTITNRSLYTNYGRIWYKGLVVDLRKRFSNRFQANVAYTLSRTVNNSFTFTSQLQVPSQPDLSIGPDAQDRRHRLEAYGLVMLPWNIQLAGVGEFRTEAPIDVFAGGRDLNGDGITNDWVNDRLCINVPCSGFDYSRNSVRELSTQEANRLRAVFGLAPIERFQNNPKFFNVDVTAQKQIRVGRHVARVRLQVVNVFNVPQRMFTSGSSANVNQNIVSGLFGRYTEVDQMRTMQLTFGYEF